MSGTQGRCQPSFQDAKQKAQGSGWGRPQAGPPPTSPLTRLFPLSIRQLKERVANLRAKHKQIYNLPVKEVDPPVNWAALVEEKLVRARLQLGRGPRLRGENPAVQGHHSPSRKESCSPCFLMFVSVRRVGLREAQLPGQSHTAEVVEIRTLLGSLLEPGLLGSWQAGGSSQICGWSLLFLCPVQSVSRAERCDHWSLESSSLSGVTLGKT